VVERAFSAEDEIVETLECGHAIAWDLRLGFYQTSASRTRICTGCRDGRPTGWAERRSRTTWR
jgi:hypothetical protein